MHRLTKTETLYIRKREPIIYAKYTKCASIDEVMFRMELNGEKWSHLDWGIFLDAAICNAGWMLVCNTYEDSNNDQHHALVKSIVDAIDTSTILDDIVTHKWVASIIAHIASGSDLAEDECYGKWVLAHIVKKFPDIWYMSYMFLPATKVLPRRHMFGQMTKDELISGYLDWDQI